MARHNYDLPLETDGSTRFLPWFIGLMVYLATLALAFSLMLTAAIDRWDSGLRGSLTVQVPVPDDGSTLDPARLQAIVSLLQMTPGVSSATPMDAEAERGLLRPWLGAALDRGILPIPSLIDVHTYPDQTIDIATVERSLDALVPGTVVATHDRWLGQVFQTARIIAVAGALAVALIGAGAALTVIFTTRTGLLIHYDVIELLHLVGAQDAYISAQFQSHAFRLAVRGGTGGMGLALLTLLAGAMVISIRSGSDLFSLARAVNISLGGWIGLLIMPLAAGLVALITARITVLRLLGRMP